MRFSRIKKEHENIGIISTGISVDKTEKAAPLAFYPDQLDVEQDLLAMQANANDKPRDRNQFLKDCVALTTADVYSQPNFYISHIDSRMKMVHPTVRYWPDTFWKKLLAFTLIHPILSFIFEWIPRFFERLVGHLTLFSHEKFRTRRGMSAFLNFWGTIIFGCLWVPLFILRNIGQQITSPILSYEEWSFTGEELGDEMTTPIENEFKVLRFLFGLMSIAVSAVAIAILAMLIPSMISFLGTQFHFVINPSVTSFFNQFFGLFHTLGTALMDLAGMMGIHIGLFTAEVGTFSLVTFVIGTGINLFSEDISSCCLNNTAASEKEKSRNKSSERGGPQGRSPQKTPLLAPTPLRQAPPIQISGAPPGSPPRSASPPLSSRQPSGYPSVYAASPPPSAGRGMGIATQGRNAPAQSRRG